MPASHTFTPFVEAISPSDEWIAYEILWAMRGHTEKKVAELFQGREVLPTQVLQDVNGYLAPTSLEAKVRDELARLSGFSICVRGMAQYPERLRDAAYPVELFQYRGDLSLVESPCISVVGARDASDDGKMRAARLARELVKHGYTIVSGLARGIDTAAMVAAIRAGGNVIGVIGTPITDYYPKENRPLQDFIGRHHLLLSQVPVYRYKHEAFEERKYHFPQRNVTMAALSSATVIVEASDRSGTLTQARAAVQQGRKLFILNNCFERKSITWPAHYEGLGAIRVRTMKDIFDNLPQPKGARLDIDADDEMDKA
jgi:DNA processing protein